jgi:prepilin-type N-terminal cleavage/methylation domain-containing protein
MHTDISVKTDFRRSSRGFTLIELLVVLGIIAVLAGLLMPVLAHGRFRAKVASCVNNYRQWGVAVNLYASSDGRGRLPSSPLAVDKMVQYKALEPWFVPYGVVTNMEPHGVTVPMWFCPARPRGLQVHQENFRYVHGREMSTIADLVDEFANFQKAAFVFPDLYWWVPRPLGVSDVEYPDPKLMKTRVSLPWPKRVDDPTVATMPFLTDKASGEKLGNSWSFSGGHEWAGAIRNSNSAYIDGHVETKAAKLLQWQAEAPDGTRAYAY